MVSLRKFVMKHLIYTFICKKFVYGSIVTSVFHFLKQRKRMSCKQKIVGTFFTSIKLQSKQIEDVYLRYKGKYLMKKEYKLKFICIYLNKRGCQRFLVFRWKLKQVLKTLHTFLIDRAHAHTNTHNLQLLIWSA